MLAHMMKLVWKRKTRNALLTLELLLSFVVVFAIAAAGVRFVQLYALPLGYSYDQAWTINIERADNRDAKIPPTLADQYLDALRSLPSVDRAAFAQFGPFTMSGSTGHVVPVGSSRQVHTNFLTVSEDFFDTSGMTLLEGRWFTRADEASGQHPAVINRRLAQELFPGKPALGQHMNGSGAKGASEPTFEVVGVTEDYRSGGDFAVPSNFMFTHMDKKEESFPVQSIVIKLKPGTPRDFERQLVRRLKQVRPDWDYTVTPQTEARATQLKFTLVPLGMLATIAFFMLVMVGFGLFGVLWQNTARRIPEIGLRRAVGASAADIYRQIVGEQMLMSSLAVGVGLFLLVQLPLTGAFGENLNWPVFAVAAVLSTAVIYLLSFACAVYPGWRASRLTPTEALHYE